MRCRHCGVGFTLRSNARAPWISAPVHDSFPPWICGECQDTDEGIAQLAASLEQGFRPGVLVGDSGPSMRLCPLVRT